MNIRILTALLLCVLIFCVLVLNSSAENSPKGDVDGDGYVTFDDARIIFDYVAGVGNMTLEQLTLADIDGDGRITAADAAQVYHYVTGVLRELPYIQRSGGVLTLLSLPEKITYMAGEELDLTGMKVVMSYFDGTSKEITDYSVSGYESNAGTKIIVISYDGLKTAFAVTVYPKVIAEIELTSLPDKLDYSRGEDLDLSGLEITAYYDDGTYETIESYAVSGFTGEEGINIIKIQYSEYTFEFTVTVGG